MTRGRPGLSRAACVAAALVLAACGGPSSGSAEGPSPGVSTSPVRATSSPTDPTSAPTLDPAHAVHRPGPFRAPLQTADMLIFRQHPLSASMVRRIQHVSGVTRVERFSLAQVSVEDHAINVAAVDPATYRNYNPDAVAQFQEEWDRIAAGEMALSPRLRKRVGRDGFVRMGTRSDAPQIHVGVFAPQIPQVDAVVNSSWVKTLGMRPGNALLVSTGNRTPLSIRKPIQRIVGHQASVQRMDAAARFGIDPSVSQNVVLVGTTANAVGSFSYSVLGGGRIAPQGSWVASHISTEDMPIIGPMTCNTLMFPQLRAALEQIRASGLAGAIHPGQYGGCYVPRFIAGTTTLSNHAFGLAFDVNVPENLRGTVGQIDRQVVAIFQQWGFTWGGTWHWTDPMHFEMNRLVRPG
jgi:D-alanyl-D-alanine carboxypeptidase